MNERRHSLVFHSLHRRHVRGGCMPVFLLLSIALIAGMLMLVKVEMTPPTRPAGEGNLLYRKDDLLETQIRQRSPLPLRLPAYMRPMRQDEGVINMPLRRTLEATVAPEELPFSTAADSVVLNRITLLELPPAKPQPAPEEQDVLDEQNVPEGLSAPGAEPAAATGKEAE